MNSEIAALVDERIALALDTYKKVIGSVVKEPPRRITCLCTDQWSPTAGYTKPLSAFVNDTCHLSSVKPGVLVFQVSKTTESWTMIVSGGEAEVTEFFSRLTFMRIVDVNEKMVTFEAVDTADGEWLFDVEDLHRDMLRIKQELGKFQNNVRKMRNKYRMPYQRRAMDAQTSHLEDVVDKMNLT